MRYSLLTASSLLFLASCAATPKPETPAPAPELESAAKIPHSGLLEIGPAKTTVAAFELPEASLAGAARPLPAYRRLADLMAEIEAAKPLAQRRDLNAKINPVSMPGRSIAEFLTMMSAKEQLGFSFILDPAVKGTVTLNPGGGKTSLQLREGWNLLESVLWLNGAYASVNGAGMLEILPLAKMSRDVQIAPFTSSATVAVEVIKLLHTPASEAFENIKKFLNEGSTAMVISRNNSILLVDTPVNIEKIKNILQVMDGAAQDGWPRIALTCRQLTPREIASQLQEILPVLGISLEISPGGSGKSASEGRNEGGRSERGESETKAEPGKSPKKQGAGVRIAVVDSLNGLVISAPDAAILEMISGWVALLDSSDNSEKELLFTYPVKFGESRDLINALLTFFPNAISPNTGSGSNKVARDQIEADVVKSFRYYGQERQQKAPQTAGERLTQGIARPVKTLVFGPRGEVIDTGTDSKSVSLFDTPMTVYEDARQNQLILRTNTRAWNAINSLLTYLDAPATQVMIQVTAVEVNLSGDLALGVNAALESKFGNKTSNVGVGNSFNKPPVFTPAVPANGLIPAKPGINPGLTAMMRTAGVDNEFALLQALSKDVKTELLNCPQIFTSNGEPGQFLVGDSVPLKTSNSSTNGGNPIEEISYQDIGVILNVTPRVSSGNRVTLDLSQEISTLSDKVVSGISSPVISKSTISNKLTVADGETMMLAGMIRHNNTETREGIPLLKDIPWIGWIFGSYTRSNEKKELVLFVKVKVIDNKTSLQKVLERYHEAKRVQDEHPELR